MRVRLPTTVCKPTNGAVRVAALAALALTLGDVVGCRAWGPVHNIALHDLQSAEVVLPASSRRVLLSDTDGLGQLYQELTPRLGLIVVRSRADWRRLAEVAPDVGDCPDLRQGIVVGLVSRAGQPVDAAWPVTVSYARVYDGGGLIKGRFEAGSYLPDASAYAELVQIPGLRAVMLVDVNGVWFTPPQR